MKDLICYHGEELLIAMAFIAGVATTLSGYCFYRSVKDKDKNP